MTPDGTLRYLDRHLSDFSTPRSDQITDIKTAFVVVFSLGVSVFEPLPAADGGLSYAGSVVVGGASTATAQSDIFNGDGTNDGKAIPRLRSLDVKNASECPGLLAALGL